MLSLPKILLTAAVIAAVWFLGRMLTRRANALMRKPERKQAGAEAVELRKCARCDTFVGADSTPCERPDCPQRA